jgi:hypothetical protein
MDPYLEASTIWPNVHTSLMTIFQEQLNPLLAPKYLAELETQVVINHVDDGILQVVRPAVLELLSPVNKRHGMGRTEYLKSDAPFCAPVST